MVCKSIRDVTRSRKQGIMDYQQIPATKKEVCVGEAQPKGGVFALG